MQDFKKYTVLIVDDEDELREAIVFDFKRKGFTVLSANDGVKALEIVKVNEVDLVVSDIRMPGGDGLSLLEKIRSFKPFVPVVILVTGFSEISEQECISKGAKTVLAKPFDRKVLMKHVLEALETADKHRVA